MNKKKVAARNSAASAASAASIAAFGSSASSFGFGSSGGFSPTAASSLSYVFEPPDLSKFSDPSTVVLFKNLSKSYETTKVKALEDLQISLGKSQEVEEAILVAWIRLYSRLATDLSRRVRQLAHVVHGAICQKSGKRIATHMPQIVGPWLAGLYDSDRGTARAANEALKLVFNSEEKIKSMWKAYHARILEFCKDAILNESANSLSDERSVSPDDAEAKFSRVIATCVLTVDHLLSELSPEDLKKRDDLYQELFGSSHLWKFAHNGDPYLRKAVYKLLQTSLKKRKDLVSANLELVISSIAVKSLATPQIGSVLDFLDALLELTLEFPDFWTVLKPSKKRTPASSINRFIKLGSQSASPNYWAMLSKFIAALPKEVLTGTLPSVRELLNTIFDTIQLGPEPRSHLVSAWNAYFSISYHLLMSGLEDEVQNYILGEAIYPIYEEYLKGDNENPRYKLPYYGAAICANGLLTSGSRSEEVAKIVTQEVWKNLEKLVLQDISREDAGGEKTGGLGERWVELSVEILRKSSPEDLAYVSVKDSNVSIVLRSVETVISHQGKSTHPAAMLEKILLKFGDVVLEDSNTQRTVTTFLAENSPGLVDSSSLPHLLGSLIAYASHTKDIASSQKTWENIIYALLDSPIQEEKKEANVLKLLQSTPSDLCGKIPRLPKLELYVLGKLQKSLERDDEAELGIVRNALHSSGGMISQEAAMDMLANLTKNLSLSEEARTLKICKQLDFVAQRDPNVLASFVRQKGGTDLLSKLLVLAESQDGKISATAVSLNKAIEQAVSKSSANKEESEQVLLSLIGILSAGVCEPSEEHISLDNLASQAKELINRAPENERATLSEMLYFSEEQWSEALKPLLQGIRNVSLAATNSLGSCTFLVENELPNVSPGTISRDKKGFSRALRMAIFIVKFLQEMNALDLRKNAHIFENISAEGRARLFYYVTFVLELAKDNLAITGTNDLWSEFSPEIEAEMIKFISVAQEFVADCLCEEDGNEHLTGSYLIRTLDRAIEESKGRSPKAFYAARVLAVIVSDLAENASAGWERYQAWKQDTNVRNTNEIFQTAGMLSGMADFLGRRKLKDVERFRNELVSDLTGVTAARAGEEGLHKLIFLNSLLSNSDDTTPLPAQRVIFLVKNLLSWFDEENEETDISPALITETAKALTGLAPFIRDVYGEHWQLVCDFVLNCWRGCVEMEEDQMPMVYATLKLYTALTSIESPNDDLADVLSSSTDYFYKALVDLLQNSKKSDEQHQPRNLCNELISRHTSGIALKHIEEVEKLYALLSVGSQPIQDAAFQLLHRYIPSRQEEISIEAALSKDEDFQMQLPPELLSMIVDTPSMDEIEEMSFVRSIPLRLRGYLLSWILIFDHFRGSSLKVKSAYIENLKEGKYLSSFLELTFDYLGYSKKLVDASKFTIESYKLNEEEDPQKDTQWLFIHLYYLVLRHTASVAKTWWMECQVRQKSIAVQEFTEKYLSPLLIDNELKAVQSWVRSQSSSPGAANDTEMQVSVSRSTHEVKAIYPIDDKTMEIVVKLPPVFPLKQVKVKGDEKVGLKEKQFKRMQAASQIAINFHSGSIVDGLTLFKRNVSLHFQGVGECAICYSILSVTPDRSLPNKTCSTCKHKFHANCLFKWFKTSNASSCPLCRTSFSFHAKKK